ncbi:MAG: helix-turn-helix domain-containing protein [Pseudomonadota bacterium]
MQFIIPDGYIKTTSSAEPSEGFDYWREAICDEFVKLDCEQVGPRPFSAVLKGGARMADLQFSEVIAEPHLVHRTRGQISRATEEDFLISFQISSEGRVRQDGREALLQPGDFAMYDSTRPYTLGFSERFHQLVVQMPKSVLGRHLIEPEKFTAVPISGRAGLGAILSNFMFSIAGEMSSVADTPDELSENLVNMIAMAFSSSVMLEQREGQSLAREAIKRRVRQYIDNNLCNPDLSNTQIAESQRISTRYLHKLFEEEDQTIHSLILTRRMDKAHEMLASSDYKAHNIETIAYNTGFNSAAHFSRAFKKHFGKSPSEVRSGLR